MKVPILIACVLILALFATICSAQDQWDKYQPRTLKELIDLNKEFLAGTDSKVHFLFGDSFPSRVKVVYTGKSRALTKERIEVIDGWSKSRKVPKEIVDLFEKEVLFVENSVEHWLPVQKQVLAYFEEELKPGQKVELFVMWIGARKEQDKVDWVFVVNEFQAEKEKH